MAKRMLIDATHPEETRVVVVNGTRVEEFDYESSNKAQVKGNIYLAKITRVEPSLQAAFVEYGGNRHGFLPFSEIHPDYYRIPIADREALLAEEEEIRRAEEAARSQREEEDDLEDADDNGRLTDVESDQAVSEVHEPNDPDDDSVSSDDADSAGETAADTDAEPASESDDEASEDAPQDTDALSQDAADEGAQTSEDDTTGNDDADLPATALTDSTEEADGDDRVDTADAALIDDATAGESQASEDQDSADQAAEEGAAPEGHDVVGDTVDPAEADKIDAGESLAAEEGQAEDDSQGDDNRSEGRGRGRRRRRRGGSGKAARASVAAIQEEVETSAESTEDLDDVARRRARLMRRYKIQEVIKRRQVLLIQVTKEERGNKGAALTTYLSLAGRYCVLMPNTAKGGGISRKISNVNDRRRLKTVLNDLDIVDGMAVIVRTAGSQRTKTEIRRDYEYLLRLWNDIRNRTMESVAPSLIHEEADLIKRCVRDLYSREMDEVLVEGEAGHKAAKSYMRMLTPSHAKHVKLYSNPSMPLFHKFRVEEQLNAMHATTVTLRSGGSIVLNQTEALVAIDVNSGKATRERHIETTALKTNLEAAEEVARQLRLRDLAGLIVIDFIDMEDPKHNREVERRLKDSMKQDRARIQLGRISPFGLLELSRQRLRPSLFEWATESCSACNGTGWVRATDSAALQVLRALIDEAVRRGAGEIQVKTPTRVALYLLNENRSQVVSTEQRYGVQIMIRADDDLDGQEYQIERLSSGPLTIEGEAQEISDADEEAVADSSDDRDGEEEGRGRRRDRRGGRRRRGDRNDRGDRGDRAGRSDEGAEDQEADGTSEQDSESARGDQPERDGDEGNSKRRRRGKRGGRRRGRRREEESNQDQDSQGADGADEQDSQADSSSEGEDAQAAAAERSENAESVSEAVAEAPASSSDTPEAEEAKPKTRRRRTRRKTEDESPAVEAAETAGSGDASAEEEKAEEKPKTRRRTRKKAEPAAEETASEAEGEEAPAPLTRKRRTRKPKAVDIPIETGTENEAKTEETAAEEEKPKPRRRRTSKKKEAEASTEAVQESAAEASPKSGNAEPDAQVAKAAEPAVASAPAAESSAAPEATAGASAPAASTEDKPAKPRRKGWWNRLLE
ncbi:Rne/Rng family ribonuclease [Rhodovibrionaceae bacterium A322]